MRLITALLLCSLTSVAWAGDDDDDELFQDTPKKEGANAGVPDANSFKEDDDDLPSFVTAAPKKEDEKAVGNMNAYLQTTRMPLEVVGREVLADNWPANIVYVDKDAVVVELPVMYARNRAEFDGIAYWLVVEGYADGKKVAESRVLVNRDAIADMGPSIQFFRLFCPVAGATGNLEIRVGKAASGAAKPTELFKRTVAFKL